MHYLIPEAIVLAYAVFWIAMTELGARRHANCHQGPEQSSAAARERNF
jgi:hypothetical protein